MSSQFLLLYVDVRPIHFRKYDCQLSPVESSEMAAQELYRRPDLSRCSEIQLSRFLHSVKASKQRRRVVEVLDLLIPSARDASASELFAPESRGFVSDEHAFRASGTLFMELFGLLKYLKTLRIYGHSLYNGIEAHWNSSPKPYVHSHTIRRQREH